jgi:hypothetical protein
MAEYRLVTVWRFEAPLTAVYAAVCDPSGWPRWWPDARRVEPLPPAGRADGVGRVWRCTWQGGLPYRLRFDIVVTRMRPRVAVAGEVRGDLEGCGRCLFSQDGAVTTVRHEWCVRTTAPWMNLLASCARPLFKRNHALAMRRGGEALARSLGVRLLGLEQADLDAVGGQRALSRLAAGGAGLIAGGCATFVQLALWWLAAVPVAEVFARDIRLAAAIVLGPDVLAGPAVPPWQVVLVAALIHGLLSCGYGLLLAPWVERLSVVRALAFGAFGGLALYVVNLYGFTALFPWFAAARDWIAVVTHLTFGIILAGGCLLLRARRADSMGMHERR